MDLRIESSTKDGTAVLGLRGEVDVYTAPKLKSSLIDLVDDGTYDIVVDLSEVDFIDSSGLSALVSGLKALRAKGGMLSLSRPHPQALTALRLTMLDRVFPIFPTIEEAVKQGPSIP